MRKVRSAPDSHSLRERSEIVHMQEGLLEKITPEWLSRALERESYLVETDLATTIYLAIK